MQIDVTNIVRGHTGIAQRQLNGANGAFPLRMRCGNMVGIAGFSDAQQRNGLWFAGEQHQRRAFADGNAAAPLTERLATRW